jgi:hypothetical protein
MEDFPSMSVNSIARNCELEVALQRNIHLYSALLNLKYSFILVFSFPSQSIYLVVTILHLQLLLVIVSVCF